MMLIPYKPVSVPKGGLIFCKYGVAALLWAAFIWKLEWAVIVGAAILAVSALATVRYAPMILLYGLTVEKLRPWRAEILDEHGMRFAHFFGAALLGIVLALLHTGRQGMGWTLLFWVAAAKTVGAFGFCAASCMYNTLFHGSTCCIAFLGNKCAVPAEPEQRITDEVP